MCATEVGMRGAEGVPSLNGAEVLWTVLNACWHCITEGG